MALPSICRFLWGDMTPFEIKKFGLLALMFLNIIGSYWLLRTLKTGVFYSIVGLEYLPAARILSFIVIIPLILIYTKLVDMYPRQRLIYLICSVFCVAFIGMTFLLTMPVVGLSNNEPSPHRLLGWIVFFSIESYGSIVVALFWSFVAASTSTGSAKKGYALIVTGGQIGSILGPLLAAFAEQIGIPILFLIASIDVGLIVALTMFYMQAVGREDAIQAANAETESASSSSSSSSSSSHSSKKSTPGIFVGLQLLLSEGYLLGIFGISTIYEVVGTIMDYQMKVLAKDVYPSPEDYTVFMAVFGVATNGLSFAIALLGTSFLLRRLGLKVCLLLYPTSVMVALAWVLLDPSLTVTFLAQVCLKGVSYAVNNPSKEMLYLPTSPDVKFKVKSWIDMFGGRSAKALGAVMVNPLKESVETLMVTGTLVSMAIVAGWMGVAVYTGNVFQRLSRERTGPDAIKPSSSSSSSKGDSESGVALQSIVIADSHDSNKNEPNDYK